MSGLTEFPNSVFFSIAFSSQSNLALSFFLFLAEPYAACGILVPQPGIEPMPPAMEGWILNHWTAREVPSTHLSSEMMKICSFENKYSNDHPMPHSV